MNSLSSLLLVDDDPTSVFLNELLLTNLKVAGRLLTAASGDQALALLATLPDSDGPALILLDVNMPGLSTLQFLEAYRQLPQANATIFLLTSTVAAHDLRRLESLPVDGLLSKPLTREKVATMLERHFQRQLPAAPQAGH